MTAFALGTPCVLAELVDTNLDVEGPQPDCVVEDQVLDTTTPIPPCDVAASGTCWKVETDPAACPLFGQLRLSIVRDEPPDPATVTQMRCVVL